MFSDSDTRSGVGRRQIAQNVAGHTMRTSNTQGIFNIFKRSPQNRDIDL